MVKNIRELKKYVENNVFSEFMYLENNIIFNDIYFYFTPTYVCFINPLKQRLIIHGVKEINILERQDNVFITIKDCENIYTISCKIRGQANNEKFNKRS